MKRREINSRFCGLLNLEKRNFRCLVDPCVFPVCSAYKVVHHSEYQNFSRVSSAHFDFFKINLYAVVKNLECRIQVIFCVELHHEKHFETQLFTTVVCEQTLYKVNVFENKQEQNL